jgi:hypothetical protein
LVLAAQEKTVSIGSGVDLRSRLVGAILAGDEPKVWDLLAFVG